MRAKVDNMEESFLDQILHTLNRKRSDIAHKYTWPYLRITYQLYIANIKREVISSSNNVLKFYRLILFLRYRGWFSRRRRYYIGSLRFLRLSSFYNNFYGGLMFLLSLLYCCHRRRYRGHRNVLCYFCIGFSLGSFVLCGWLGSIFSRLLFCFLI